MNGRFFSLIGFYLTIGSETVFSQFNLTSLDITVNNVYEKPVVLTIPLDENGQIDEWALPANVAVLDMNQDDRMDAFIYHENKLELHYGLTLGFSKEINAQWEFTQPIKSVKPEFEKRLMQGKLNIEFADGNKDFIMQWHNKMLLKSEYDARPDIYQKRTEMPSQIRVDDNFQLIWQVPDFGDELFDRNMLIGDLDQDGKKELIFQSWPIRWGDLVILNVYENTSDNAFELVYTYEDTVYEYGVKEITDLDADGKLEITAFPGGGPPGWTLNPYLVIFESTGDNTFRRYMIPAYVTLDAIRARCMRWVDSDLNGKPELIIGFTKDIYAQRSYVHFYENLNPGTFDQRGWWLLVYQLPIHGLAVGDLDNDGWGEIFVGMTGASTQLRRWEYTNIIGDHTFAQKWFETGLCSPIYPEIFDFDDDGQLEFTALSDWWDYYPGRSAILYLDTVGDDSLEVLALDSTSYYHGSFALWGRNWNRVNSDYYLTAPAEIYVQTLPSYFNGYGILLKMNSTFTYPFEPIFYSPTVDSIAIHHALAADLDNDNKVELITGRTLLPARIRMWEEVITSIASPLNENSPKLLVRNYPNPFNGTTKIQVSLANPEVLDIRLYNVLGQEIQIIEHSRLFSSGNHEITLNEFPSSGLFYLRIKSAYTSNTVKLLHLK
jgi:hypothetical protein